jgi:hypothetical protein
MQKPIKWQNDVASGMVAVAYNGDVYDDGNSNNMMTVHKKN